MKLTVFGVGEDLTELGGLFGVLGIMLRSCWITLCVGNLLTLESSSEVQLRQVGSRLAVPIYVDTTCSVVPLTTRCGRAIRRC